MTPEQKARIEIDRMLVETGWQIHDLKDANIHACRGVAIREFPLKSGHGEADYLLYVDGQACGVIEAKPAGYTLSGVEIQSDKYKHGLPEALPAWFRPLPFCYQSTGIETHFTSGLDPEPRSRGVFSFHRPETLADWLMDARQTEPGVAAEDSPVWTPQTYRSRQRCMPPLHSDGLWPAQFRVIGNLEKSLAADRPRSMVQMATGSGKIFTAVSFIYRQLKFFKWIKQNLRIKTFYGTSENAVKAQIWIAVSVYVLVSIMKKRLKIEASLYTILQVLSVTIFERMPLIQVLTESAYENETGNSDKQLFLFS